MGCGPYTEGKREQIPKFRAKRAKKKSGFGPYTEGKREEKISNLRAKRAEKMVFLAVYKEKRWKITKKRPPEAAANFDKNKPPHIQIG